MTARDNEKVSDERLIRDLDHAMRTGYIRPMLLTETIEHLRTSQEWVDVRERLPEIEGNYWVAVKLTDKWHTECVAEYFMGNMFGRRKGWHESGKPTEAESFAINDTVIAWHRLPDSYTPPKGEAP